MTYFCTTSDILHAAVVKMASAKRGALLSQIERRVGAATRTGVEGSSGVFLAPRSGPSTYHLRETATANCQQPGMPSPGV
jgi:hypothetical protein